MKTRAYTIALPLLAFFLSINIFAQGPAGINKGLIITAQDSIMGNNKGVTPPIVLDPNQDGWITDGTNLVVYNSTNFYPFTTNIDLEFNEFEIPYKRIHQYETEPTADLQTGPTCGQSELVDVLVSSYEGGYYYLDETTAGGPYLLIRERVAQLASGAFGFSVLFDTDGLFGTSVDPNAVVGNPGFEYEILFSSGSNGKIEVLWVDGNSASNTFTTLASYPLSTNAMTSNSIKTNCPSNEPVFYDFFIKLSDFNATGVPAASPTITSSSSFRMAIATATSPGSALGGSASDIMGIDDGGNGADDDALFTTVINAYPTASFALGDLTDTDGDGITDQIDLDDDNDGILDIDEGYLLEDSDGDGIPNRLDLDSDNDGIADVIEAGGTDSDGDGVIGTGSITDTDGDGIDDTVDTVDAGSGASEVSSGTALTFTDNDSDGLKNPYDNDSDNDGIVDLIEAQTTNSFVTLLGTDTDNDGIDDAFDSDYIVVGAEITLGHFIIYVSDVDIDGIPDYLDLDSDDDGITDQVESGITADVSTLDSDNDGILDDYDADGTSTTNTSGASNGGQTPTTFPDTNAPIGDRDWREDLTNDIIWNGTNWLNTTGINIAPKGITLKRVRIMSGTTTTVGSATVGDLIIEPNAILEITGCLNVIGLAANNGGLITLIATGNLADQYGQYLGPSIPFVECQMWFGDGWHNISFPVSVTASGFADYNNTISEPNLVNLTGDATTQNLQWYDSHTSGGKEQGFFIEQPANSVTYSTHAYGTWNLVSDGSTNFPAQPSDEDLSSKGYSYYMSSYHSNGTNVLKAFGTTNYEPKTFSTSNNFGGFNLIPNIFPVSISTGLLWNDATYGLGSIGDIDKAIYIWNPEDNYVLPDPGNYSKGSYLAFDPETGVTIHADITGKADQLIAPFQSFYIRRTSASTLRRKDEDGSILHATEDAVPSGITTDPSVTENILDVTIHPNFRSSCLSTKHYKTNNVSDVILLSVKDSKENKYSDAFELVYADHYTNKLDPGYDILKLGNNKKRGS